MPTTVDLGNEQPATQSTGIVQVMNAKSLMEGLFNSAGGDSTPKLGHNNINETGMGAYIFNASDQSPNWPTQKDCGLKNGEFGLMENGSMSRVHPLKFFLLYSEGFKTDMNKQGMIVRASRDMDLQEPKMGEHYVSVLIVDTGSRFVAVKYEARWAKAPTIRTAVNKLKQAIDPNWFKESEAHKFAAQIPLPWARVFHSCTTVTKISRSGPNAGNPYELAQVVSTPTTGEQISRLNEALKDQKFQSGLQAALNLYAMKVNELEGKCS